MATVELEAGRYHYAEYGDRSAPPLVLLHGMPSDGSTWAGIAPELTAGYRVVAPVATLFAERYPARLAGLILVDSPPPDGSGAFDPGPRPDGDLPYDWAVVPAILAQLNDPDPAWWAELPAISAPTLVIGGGSTSPVPSSCLPSWRA